MSQFVREPDHVIEPEPVTRTDLRSRWTKRLAVVAVLVVVAYFGAGPLNIHTHWLAVAATVIAAAVVIWALESAESDWDPGTWGDITGLGRSVRRSDVRLRRLRLACTQAVGTDGEHAAPQALQQILTDLVAARRADLPTAAPPPSTGPMGIGRITETFETGSATRPPALPPAVAAFLSADPPPRLTEQQLRTIVGEIEDM
ncbi:hypothetical protein [Rudaeicoccus suwonensis]|uniref:Uncharacterized protein n=1 Tax=Rudaeicoccus suwonensis TaxID=657409 RepID=A0A561ECT6_9MICO|nr:hypothetical protein [Rudaeicoccus suwonensis]TWE13421.1 hypothetical protein BKA23_2251 [Rudaeicoccus suwonensis]